MSRRKVCFLACLYRHDCPPDCGSVLDRPESMMRSVEFSDDGDDEVTVVKFVPVEEDDTEFSW